MALAAAVCGRTTACMTILLLTLGALLALIAAGYAHHAVPRFTVGSEKVHLTRTVLLVTGVATGLVAASGWPDAAPRMLAFLCGFGLVHVPAAMILLLKRARAAGRS
jgi:hypothetical protein